MIVPKKHIMAKYSKGAQEKVESAMKRMEKGTLRSGKSNKKVTNPKQAIAIGLSEARKKGAKVPAKASTKKATKKAAPVKTAKKATAKKAAPKKAAVKKKASPLKKASVNKKVATRKKETTKEQEKNTVPPAELNRVINSEQPPVEEKSPVITPALSGQAEAPIMITDKRALAKAVTKYDPKHPMQLSGVKRSIRPSGKKPLWH